MKITKIKKDAEIATIDYSDNHKVSIHISKSLHWMVYDRASKKTVSKSFYDVDNNYDETRVAYSLPIAARKYCIVVDVWITIRLKERSGLQYTEEFYQEVYATIRDKIKVLNDNSFFNKMRGKLYQNDSKIEITYSLYSGDILSVPKRTK